MQLDVSAPVVTRRARSIRTQIVESALRGRVVDDCARGIGQDDVELVVDTWFSRVPGANGKIDVTELVRPGSATDLPGTHWLARFRVRAVATIIPEKVACNTGPVNVQACAVINVLEVPPGRRTVLASASHAEIRPSTVVYDPTPAGQEVAGRQRSPGFYWRCCCSPDHQHRASHDECNDHESGCQSADSFCSFVHFYFLLSHLAHPS